MDRRMMTTVGNEVEKRKGLAAAQKGAISNLNGSSDSGASIAASVGAGDAGSSSSSELALLGDATARATSPSARRLRLRARAHQRLWRPFSIVDDHGARVERRRDRRCVVVAGTAGRGGDWHRMGVQL
jgi:hypothetical protein